MERQKIKAAAIAQRLRDLGDLLAIAKEQSNEAAPKMIRELMDDGVSLRAIAKRTELSPSYVSCVLRGTQAISDRAFCLLADVYESR